jgi:hypothetical protein
MGTIGNGSKQKEEWQIGAMWKRGQVYFIVISITIVA